MPDDGDTDLKKVLDLKGFVRQLQDIVIRAIHLFIYSTSAC